MENEEYIGVIEDPRTEEQKSFDYQHSEITSAVIPVIWQIKTPDQWKKYSIRDQDGSSSCVEQAKAKAKETISGVVESARNYRFRNNFPAPGMYQQDAGNIEKNIGTDTEANAPSQKMSETQMNADYTPVDPKKATTYIFVPFTDIEQIAQVIRDQKHCTLTFNSNYDEWQSVPQFLGTPVKWGHCVCGTDFTMYEGKKALIVDESWGVGATLFNAQRVITEDFLKARCTSAMYYIYPTGSTPTKPQYNFTRQLQFGLVNDNDVKALQACLSYDGEFPLDAQYHTGNFGNITLNAVKKFQLKYASEILTPAGLTVPTGIVGPNTRAKLNSLFN